MIIWGDNFKQTLKFFKVLANLDLRQLHDLEARSGNQVCILKDTQGNALQCVLCKECCVLVELYPQLHIESEQ